MQRIFAFLVLTVLLLGGCGADKSGSPSSAPGSAAEKLLTEAEVLTAYEAAAEAYDWFNLSALPVSGEVVQADGRDFQVVTDARFPTLTALEAHLKTLFSDELTAELLADGQYRDIDGKLCGTGGARGSNIYMVGKTASAAQTEEGRWTVTLTFYADSWEMERPAATIGYSRKTIDYVNQDGKWVFSTFCPGDDLDLEAETVYHFTYDDAFFSAADFESWSIEKLALWMLRADGGWSEGPSDILSHRALTDTDNYFAVMVFLSESLWENAPRVCVMSASNAANWFTFEEQVEYEAVLETYVPKNAVEESLLENLKDIYHHAIEPIKVYMSNQFSFHVDGGMLCLGDPTGNGVPDFPWGFNLTEKSRKTSSGDGFGTVYEVDCGSVTVSYIASVDGGNPLLYRMTTDQPGVPTAGGVAVGDSLERVQEIYPSAVPWGPSDGEIAWVYEPGEHAWCKHIVFYIKDGVVAKIEIEDLIDGRLLPE